MRSRRPGGASVAAAMVALALAAAVGLLWWPCAYSGESVTSGINGTIRHASSCASLVEVNGASVLWVLAVPVVLTTLVLPAVSLGRRTLAWAAATVLALFALAAGFSVGLFFLPAAGVSIAAAAMTRTPTVSRRLTTDQQRILNDVDGRRKR